MWSANPPLSAFGRPLGTRPVEEGLLRERSFASGNLLESWHESVLMDADNRYITMVAEKRGLVENARKNVFSMAANTKQGSTFANALRVAMF